MFLKNFPFAGLLVAALAGPVCAAEEIRIATGHGAISQTALSVLHEAYRRIGITVYDTATRADQSLLDANRGELDGLPARVAGLELKYPNLIRVPVAVVTVDAMVFGNRTPLALHGWESLRPYRIGILKGVQYAEDGTRGMKVDVFADNTQLFTKLESEEIDFAVATRIEGVLKMRELRTRKVTMLEPPLAKVVLYHYLNASHRDLVPKITASLAAMEHEGRMRHILQQTLARMLEETRASGTKKQ
ncbi:transporter substrate-binding domain-containing protein [Pseudoduganella ginsengisoli]|uniref:Transporter substrate-binding domain-containing protein n=1 Tax=Pseudoduganella ginsengisoli TaxID=1462440 RepID=A0A6L6Q6A0_9BURK|nr:transporter substrate-binding domain-containing protein [Pseudoduganella ginsengisoli]MTW04801.1 transporter substrate-binding domain-containing protein [Pseudoduganella ginsengisoli]